MNILLLPSIHQIIRYSHEADVFLFGHSFQKYNLDLTYRGFVGVQKLQDDVQFMVKVTSTTYYSEFEAIALMANIEKLFKELYFYVVCGCTYMFQKIFTMYILITATVRLSIL